MSARDDHAARVMAGVSEPQCWAALFNEVDELRALLHAQEQAFDADSKEAADRLTELDARLAAVAAALDMHEQLTPVHQALHANHYLATIREAVRP